MKKKIVFIVLIAGLVIAAAFIPGLQKAEAVPATTGESTTVEVPAVPVLPVSAPVSVGIVAEAKLVPEREVTLGFANGGVLGAVNVSEGETVKKGTVLAVLDGYQQYEAVVAEAELAIATATRSKKELEDAHPADLSAANLALIQAKLDLDAIKKEFEPFDTPEYRTKIDDANKAIRDKQTVLDDAQELVDDVADLAPDSARRIQVEDDFKRVSKEYDALVRAYNLLVNDKAMAEENITAAEATFADAQRLVDELANGPREVEMNVITRQLNAASMQKKAAEKQIELMKLVAPFDGKVVFLDAEAGSLINPGAPVAVVVADTVLRLETVDLSETKIKDIQLDQVVTVVFDAFPDTPIRGKVVKITNWAEKYLGDVVFPVEIELEATDLPLYWGMTASVTF